MKTTVDFTKPEFHPITITITLQSREELAAYLALMTHQKAAAEGATEVAGFSTTENVEKLLDGMAPAGVYNQLLRAFEP